jgi:nucleoside-diphosphate-sugar epimerase
MEEVVNGRSVLITGGVGYIGTGLTACLVKHGWDISCTVRAGSALTFLSGGRAAQVQADVCDPDVWLKTAQGMDAIIHLAGQTSTYVANEDPVGDEAINVRPMIRLLETCRRQGWRPFIVFASTVTVIGLPEQLPVQEDHMYQPITVYDLHKLMAEEYLKMYCRLGYVRGATLRLANVYGPGRRSSGADRGILNAMIRKALAGQPLTVYGNGEWMRDYIYIDDVVNAFTAALEHQQAVNGRHWIIASGQGCTIREAFHLVAERVARRTGVRVPVEHVDLPGDLSPIEKRNFVADIGEFFKASGWRPTVGLKEGIDQTIDAFIKETDQ